MSEVSGPKNFMPFEAASKAVSTEKNADKIGANDKASENQKVREVADQYEKFFIKEMMRHMKSTLNEDGGLIKKNNAEKIFTEQLDEQYSEQWNKRGGFGLSDIIYKNVTERYADQLPSEGAKSNGGVEILNAGKLKMAAGGEIKKPDDFSHEQMLWQIDNLNKIK